MHVHAYSTRLLQCTYVYYCRWSRKNPPEYQRCFSDFVMAAGEKYRNDQELQFIKDLLQLKYLPIVASKSPEVEAVHESFCENLKNFIKRYKLGDEVCILLRDEVGACI